MDRRRLMQAAASIAAFSWAGRALAQDYPSRPVRFLMGVAAGSVPDVIIRQIAEPLSPLLGQPVVVENRPSAGGIIALEALRSSPPDGHTLSLVHSGQMSVAPSLFAKLPYDPARDFAHVGILFRGVQVLVAHPSVQARTLGELITLARSRPGTLRYGSPATGSPNHLSMELLNEAAGIGLQHIPYRGPAALLAVLSGEVELMLEGLEPLLPHLREGRLKPLAVGGTRRLAALPELPTFAEQGVQGIGSSWLGVVAPPGTPDGIIERLNRDLATVMRSDAIRQSFAVSGREIEPGTPAAMRATIAAEIPQWREVVRRAGITPT